MKLILRYVNDVEPNTQALLVDYAEVLLLRTQHRARVMASHLDEDLQLPVQLHIVVDHQLVLAGDVLFGDVPLLLAHLQRVGQPLHHAELLLQLRTDRRLRRDPVQQLQGRRHQRRLLLLGEGQAHVDNVYIGRGVAELLQNFHRCQTVPRQIAAKGLCDFLFDVFAAQLDYWEVGKAVISVLSRVFDR